MHDFEIHVAFHQLLEVALAILEHHVDFIKMIAIKWYDQINELYNVRVLKLSEYDNFPQNSLANNYVMEDVTHAFDSDFFTCLNLNCLGNLAVAALTNESFNLVLGANLPVSKFFLSLKWFEKRHLFNTTLCLHFLFNISFNLLCLHG
jgi:hypothetical protein